MTRQIGGKTNRHTRGDQIGNMGHEVDSFTRHWAAGTDQSVAPSGRTSGSRYFKSPLAGGVGFDSYLKMSHKEEIVSLGGNTSVTSTNNLLPANSLIKHVVVTPLTDITSITSYNIGDTTTAARFKSGSTKKTIAGGPEIALTHWTGTVAIVQTAAAKVKLVADTGGSGYFHICVWYEQVVGGLVAK